VRWRFRSVTPNPVRGNLFEGRGNLEATKMQDGLGINGEIRMQIWDNFNGRFYGSYARIDSDGNVVILGAKLSKFQRDNAPANFRFAPWGEYEVYRSVTSSTYTPVTGDRWIAYSNAGGTLTLPSASAAGNTVRRITVFNDHGSADLVVTGQDNIPAGKNMTYLSTGSVWREEINPEGTGSGSGDDDWVDVGLDIFRNSKVTIGSTASPTAKLMLGAGTATAATAPLKFISGTNMTAQEAGAVEYDGQWLYLTVSSPLLQRQTVMTNSNVGTLTNKTWQGNAIDVFYIDGTAAAGSVLTTSGSEHGSFWGPNFGSTRVYGTSNSAIASTLATLTLPDNTAGEIEVTMVGYDPSGSGKAYKKRWTQAYLKDGGTLTLKGSQSSLGSDYASDFTPAASITGIASSNNYALRVSSSVAAETVTWTAYYVVKYTYNPE
jgi:hypothetical protein